MLVLIGYDNFVESDKIDVVLSPKGNPPKTLQDIAKGKDRFIDACAGRKARSLIVLTDGFVIRCALAPDTLKNRIDEAKNLSLRVAFQKK